MNNYLSETLPTGKIIRSGTMCELNLWNETRQMFGMIHKCERLFLIFSHILVLSAEFTNYTSSSEYQGVLMGKFQTLNKWSSFNIKNHYGLEEGQLCWSLVICWSSLDQEKLVNPFEFAIMKALAWVPNHPNSGSNVWTCQLQGYGCGNMMACLVCSKKHASNKL